MPSARVVSNALMTHSLASRTEIGGLSASSNPIRFASSITSSGGTTRFANPRLSASQASTNFPVSTSSIALNFPSVRVSRWVPPAPGIRPTLISGWPKRAVSDATMMSHCIASSQPPPSANPLTAAMSGFEIALIRSHSATRLLVSIEIGVWTENSLRSAPAANTFGPPVRTIARMLSSRSSSSSAATSSSISGPLRALSCFGRLSVMTPTGPSRSTRMYSNAIRTSWSLQRFERRHPIRLDAREDAIQAARPISVSLHRHLARFDSPSQVEPAGQQAHVLVGAQASGHVRPVQRSSLYRDLSALRGDRDWPHPISHLEHVPPRRSSGGLAAGDQRRELDRPGGELLGPRRGNRRARVVSGARVPVVIDALEEAYEGRLPQRHLREPEIDRLLQVLGRRLVDRRHYAVRGLLERVRQLVGRQGFKGLPQLVGRGRLTTRYAAYQSGKPDRLPDHMARQVAYRPLLAAGRTAPCLLGERA